MKLYLSSYQLGDNPEKLAQLFSDNKKIGIIPNSLDFSTDRKRVQKNLDMQTENLLKIGLEPEILDLKGYFNKEDELKAKINELGGIWVLGGNSFVLRVAYKQSGFDNIVLELSKNNPSFVYAGYSAGCCVLQKSLKGIEFVDDPELVKQTYSTEVIWEGVGILDYVFVPHFESDHDESEDTNIEIESYRKNNIEYKALRDGEVIISETN